MSTKPDDASDKPAARGTVTEPRGSKLDAKRRAEYEAEAALAKTWDTSAWPTWTVTGRVLPERCGVWVAQRPAGVVGAMGKVMLRVEVIQSQIVAVCAAEKGPLSVFEIADAVRSTLAFPVDYIAFQNRAAYEIVLDVCINNQTGAAQAIPVFEPTFEVEDAGLCFDFRVDKSHLIIPYEAGSEPAFATALHDLTSAVRYPRRTFEYCRMAAEVVRQHFDPPTIRNDKKRWIAGEKAMSDALGVTRASLTALDAVAARSRHGELIFSISWGLRKRALEFAWELVARFSHHLQGAASHDNWKLLDVRFED
jgi:hypothetical protein